MIEEQNRPSPVIAALNLIEHHAAGLENKIDHQYSATKLDNQNPGATTNLDRYDISPLGKGSQINKTR